jgi:predicted transporter
MVSGVLRFISVEVFGWFVGQVGRKPSTTPTRLMAYSGFFFIAAAILMYIYSRVRPKWPVTFASYRLISGIMLAVGFAIVLLIRGIQGF